MVAGGDIDKDLILAEGQYPVIANALTGDGIVGYYDKEYRVNAPAVTVTGRGDVGHAKARLVNFTPVVRLLSVKSEHDVFFLENAINTLKIVIESTGVPQLTVPQLAKYEVAFPRQLDEEEHIGVFFKQLDHLITLHQREFAFLCKEKSKKFRYIKNAWEQRKVTEIGKIYIGLVTTMTKHYTDEGTLLIRNSDIKDGKFEFGDNPIYLEKTFAEKNETRMHQIGDVITVHTGDVGTSAVITENEAKSIGFATIVTRPNPKIIDSNYLCSFLNTDKHKKWAVSISTGDGRTNYNLGDYFELVVPVPSIAEQKKIASYIQKLNRLITLHQRKPVVVNSSSTMNALPNQHLYFQVLE